MMLGELEGDGVVEAFALPEHHDTFSNDRYLPTGFLNVVSEVALANELGDQSADGLGHRAGAVDIFHLDLLT